MALWRPGVRLSYAPPQKNTAIRRCFFVFCEMESRTGHGSELGASGTQEPCPERAAARVRLSYAPEAPFWCLICLRGSWRVELTALVNEALVALQSRGLSEPQVGPIGPDSVVNQAPMGLESRILSASKDECVRLSYALRRSIHKPACEYIRLPFPY